MKKTNLTTGFQVWFGFILGANALLGLVVLEQSPLVSLVYFGTAIGSIGLFKLKAWGFWIIVASGVFGIVILQQFLMSPLPIILYFSLKKGKNHYWEQLD